MNQILTLGMNQILMLKNDRYENLTVCIFKQYAVK